MALPGRFQKAGQHIVILSRFGWNIKTEEQTHQFIEDDEEVLSKISSHWPTLTQREERV
jgi:hypothetical protein